MLGWFCGWFLVCVGFVLFIMKGIWVIGSVLECSLVGVDLSLIGFFLFVFWCFGSVVIIKFIVCFVFVVIGSE